MKRLFYLLVATALFAACVPFPETPASVVTAVPSIPATVTPAPVSTEQPTNTPAAPTAALPPMEVVPVSASPLTLTEFNAGTEMKRLNVIGTGTPHDIEFSPNGKLFAVATERGVYLYDGITFEQTGFIDVNDSVSAIAFSPEGDALAVAVNGKASLWNVLSGQKLLDFEEEMINIVKLAYGRGGYVAAIGGECRGCGEPVGAMILWNARTGHRIYEEHEIWYGTSVLTFNADGTRLIFGGKQGVTAIESGTGKLVRLYGGVPGANAPYNLMFNNDESHFLISTYFFDEFTALVDIATQEEMRLSHCGFYLTRAKEMGACSNQKSIVLIDGMNGQKIKSFDIDVDEDTLRDMFALSPDGRLLAYYGKYGIYVLETETGNKIKTLNFNNFTLAQAGMVELDGSNKYAAAMISSFGQVEIYDLQTGNVLRTIKSDCCAILGFAFAPDQKTAATVDNEKILILWDLQSGKAVYKVMLSNYEDDPIAFSPDGTSLFFIKESVGGVSEFIFATGKIVNHGTDNYGYIRADESTNDNLHFNKLGNLVMFEFQNNPVFEDMQTGSKTVIPFQMQADADFNIKFAYSSDEQFLSTGVFDGILVWDLETYKIVSTLVGHETRGGDGWAETIRSLMSNPQSNLLISVGWDGTTRLWNIATGTELRRLNVCCSTSFTPDGRYLVTAGDGVIRVWGIPK